MRVSDVESKPLSTPETGAPIPPDSRLTSPRFKASVRVVLEFLGLDSTLGNFRKHDVRTGGLIRDWELFADRISSPRFTAVVQVIGSFSTIAIDLPGVDREEALKKLDTKYYEFKNWF